MPHAAQPTATDHSAYARATQRKALHGLNIRLRWSGDVDLFKTLVKPQAALEGFRLLRAEEDASEKGVWRCSFAYVGGDLGEENRLTAFLRRLGTTAQWLVVEKVFEPAGENSPTPFQGAA